MRVRRILNWLLVDSGNVALIYNTYLRVGYAEEILLHPFVAPDQPCVRIQVKTIAVKPIQASINTYQRSAKLQVVASRTRVREVDMQLRRISVNSAAFGEKVNSG